MTNLHVVCDQIKTAMAAAGDTPTAKLIAILEAAGICNTAELAALVGISERGVRKARNSSSASCGTPVPERNHSSGTTVPQRNHSSENGTTVPPRARVEDNNLLTNLEHRLILNTPLPPKKPNLHAQALEAFEAYNETALRCGLPQAAKFTPDRKRKIIARLKDYGPDGWQQALANIDRSKFLCGENDRGWRASLDFLLQPSSFAKVHDGGYGNGRHADRPKKPIVYDAFALKLREEAIASGWEPNA